MKHATLGLVTTVILSLLYVSACAPTSPIIQSGGSSQLTAVDTIIPCRDFNRKQFTNIIVTEQTMFDSMENRVREFSACADFEFDSVDFTQHSVASIEVRYSWGRWDRVEQVVEVDHTANKYSLVSKMYEPDTLRGIDPANHSHSILLLIDAIDTTYTVETRIDTIAPAGS